MEPTALQIVTGVVATLAVTLVNLYVKKSGKRIGRAWLTAGLFAVASVLAVIFQPVSLPPFPAYAGDPVTFSQAMITYISAMVSVAGAVTGFATLIYNTLVAKVLDRLDPLAARLM